MNTKETLLAFSAVCGVSGREEAAAAFGRRLLEPFGKVETTPLGSLICRVREPAAGQPHLMLDAHMDEIGLIVTSIQEEGFLKVAGCGGINRQLLLASQVTVHAEGGNIPGVVCSVPPHLSGDSDKKFQKVEEVSVDIGMDKEQAKALVQPGDRLTFIAQSKELLGNCVSGKALDNRASCVALAKALEYLQDTPLECGLTVVFSTMEEVGGQGAQTAAYIVSPTHSIAVDVSFAQTPDCPKEKCGQLKGGPMIGFSPILSHKLSKKLIRLSEKQGIPYQTEVMGGRTGTNADSIATSRGGVVTGLLSIPQKYMHSPIELVSVEDVENTGRLLAAFAGILGKEAI
ncbi:M42 family metallopeptidase [Oscillospiraceae bacterium MB08-C2-2]|nr:M42 family metallopeptidase [Oscillospiraceae bacterium MB08-C2-2]